MGEDKPVNSRYVLSEIPTQHALVIHDSKEGKNYSTEEALTILLNKVDNIEKYVNTNE
jgi:hypothetical protein